jgi:hypothetical protein
VFDGESTIFSLDFRKIIGVERAPYPDGDGDLDVDRDADERDIARLAELIIGRARRDRARRAEASPAGAGLVDEEDEPLDGPSDGRGAAAAGGTGECEVEGQ